KWLKMNLAGGKAPCGAIRCANTRLPPLRGMPPQRPHSNLKKIDFISRMYHLTARFIFRVKPLGRSDKIIIITQMKYGLKTSPQKNLMYFTSQPCNLKFIKPKRIEINDKICQSPKLPYISKTRVPMSTRADAMM
ncbi:MAG: hypothetical protein J6S69_00625, partial [Proteobacteria bacterium]|nr:hypothetical protein [Pseudomonadota bacterium]